MTHPLRVRSVGGLPLRLRPCLFSGGDRRLPPDPFGAQGLLPAVSGEVLPAKWPAAASGDRAGCTEPAGGSGGDWLLGGGRHGRIRPRRAVEGSTAEAGYGLRDPAPQRGSVRPAGRASDPGGPAVCRLRKGQLIPAFRCASELGELTWIEAGGTGGYTARDGILFSGTELAAFPAGRTGIFEMPKDVTSIRASAFANTNLDKIDMRNCISILCDEAVIADAVRLELPTIMR